MDNFIEDGGLSGGPAASGKWLGWFSGAAGPRWWVHVMLLAVVAAMAYYLIATASNPNLALSYDQAEYVGAARDFLETGRFLESTHSRSLGVLLPLGYPALIALVTKAFGTTPHHSALYINLLAGTILPLLVYWLVWRSTASVAWAIWAGLVMACHWSLVNLASRAMTDPLYICLFTGLAILIIAQFSQRKPSSVLALGGLGGLIVGSMYLLRISALFLIIGLPVLWTALNALTKKMAWRDLALSVLLFLALTLPVMGAVSWRFYQVNGDWGISPQVSFNAQMGDVKAGLDSDPWTLDESGELVIRQGGAVPEGAWTEVLREKLKSLTVNLFNNLLYLKRLLFPPEPVPGIYWLALAALVAARLLSTGARQAAQKAGIPLPKLRKGNDAAAKMENGWRALTRTSAQILALTFAGGTLLTVGRSGLQVVILFMAFGGFVFLWHFAQRHDATEHQLERNRILCLMVTGYLTVMNVLAYSFLNTQERYIAQTLPLASVCAQTLLFAVLAGAPTFFPLTGRLSSSTAEHKGKAPSSQARRSLLGNLVFICAIFLLSDATLQQARHSNFLAKQREAISASQPSAVRDAGELIKDLAKVEGKPVRVLQNDSGVAYYAHGEGFIVPYLEVRPDRLLNYLSRQQINFVSCPPFTAFYAIYSGIGIHHLLSALVSAGYPDLIGHQNGLVFQINRHLSLRLTAHGASFPEQGVPLSAEGYHLVWLTLRHESPISRKGYKKLNTVPSQMMELCNADERIALAGNTLCPSPAPLTVFEGPEGEKASHPGLELAYYQLVRLPNPAGPDDSPWHIGLSQRIPKDLTPVRYRLYAIEGAAETSAGN